MNKNETEKKNGFKIRHLSFRSGLEFYSLKCPSCKSIRG